MGLKVSSVRRAGADKISPVGGGIFLAADGSTEQLQSNLLKCESYFTSRDVWHPDYIQSCSGVILHGEGGGTGVTLSLQGP